MSASTNPLRLRLFAPDSQRAETQAPPKLWFAILTYNALAYTQRCLVSLDLHTNEPWRAVILDNGSVDGTRDWLRALDDPRIAIELGVENRGVAGGRNRLLDLIGDRVPDDGFIVFIDNDLEFFAGWLEPFRALFARDPRVGMASANGYEFVVTGSRRELLSYPGLVPMPVDVVSGGFACFVRPAVFREIGYYDEQLNPFWHEDDDITVRAQCAGWKAFAAPTPAIVHHGHKSGIAIDATAAQTSLEKQAYLIGKWRKNSLIAPDGRLHYGNESDIDTLGALLAHRMQRPFPVRRSEQERARLDIGQLAHTIDTLGALTERRQFASAPALAMLDELIAQQPANTRWISLRDAVVGLRESRRRATRLPTPDTPATLCKIADVNDWNDDEFVALAQHVGADGRGRAHWFDRTAYTWDATQLARMLLNVTASLSSARVVMLGDLRRALGWRIAAHVQSVVVADVLARYGAPSDTVWLDDAARFAPSDAPVDRVRAVDIAALPAQIAPLGADVGILVPWSNDTSLNEYAALLHVLLRHLSADAVVLVVLPIRLAGPPHAHALESVARIPQWLAAVGLELLSPVDTSISDDGLLAASDVDAHSPRTPDLLRADGARLIGRVSLACKRRTT